MSDPHQPEQPHQPHYNPYHPNAAGQGSYGYSVVPDHPQATTVLIMGILGVALCQLVSPFAWYLGGKARKEIQASHGTLGGSTQVTIGWALGIVGSILLILGLLGVILYVIVVVALVGASAA